MAILGGARGRPPGAPEQPRLRNMSVRLSMNRNLLAGLALALATPAAAAAQGQSSNLASSVSALSDAVKTLTEGFAQLRSSLTAHNREAASKAEVRGLTDSLMLAFRRNSDTLSVLLVDRQRTADSLRRVVARWQDSAQSLAQKLATQNQDLAGQQRQMAGLTDQATRERQRGDSLSSALTAALGAQQTAFSELFDKTQTELAVRQRRIDDLTDQLLRAKEPPPTPTTEKKKK